MVHRSLSGWWRQRRQAQQAAGMQARSPNAALNWHGEKDNSNIGQRATATAHVVLTRGAAAGSKAGQQNGKLAGSVPDGNVAIRRSHGLVS